MPRHICEKPDPESAWQHWQVIEERNLATDGLLMEYWEFIMMTWGDAFERAQDILEAQLPDSDTPTKKNVDKEKDEDRSLYDNNYLMGGWYMGT